MSKLAESSVHAFLGLVFVNSLLGVLGGALFWATGGQWFTSITGTLGLLQILGAAWVWCMLAAYPRLPVSAVVPSFVFLIWTALGAMPLLDRQVIRTCVRAFVLC